MRLTLQQRGLLKEEFVKELGQGCEILLFGSRTDDDARGGDVDLLVRSRQTLERKVWLSSLLAARAQRILNGRKVDVLLIDPTTSLQQVHLDALKTGIPL